MGSVKFSSPNLISHLILFLINIVNSKLGIKCN